MDCAAQTPRISHDGVQMDKLFEKISQDMIADLLTRDGSICAGCAEAYGAVWPEGHVATCSVGVCVLCNEHVPTCAVSDWSWPQHRGKKAPREF